MIELTPEQRQAVAQGEPIRVMDPATQNWYVLVRAEIYERLVDASLLPAVEVSSLISAAMLRAQQAFWRDLPELLKNRRHHGQWVAYHGDEQIGLGKTATELYQRCLLRGFQRGEFYVGKVETAETPPWEPTPLEESLYEFTDDPPAPQPFP
jgi:hypothetical protein